jgi:hypothetical protein
VFTADLKEARAPRETGVRQSGHRPAGPPGDLVVDDHVESREVQTASARLFLAAGRHGERSMNLVLSRPAMKSGSFRIRRCMVNGLHALDHRHLSARFMRTIAS